MLTLAVTAKLVRVKETIFGATWIVTAGFLAALAGELSSDLSWMTGVWILLAFVSARASGMCFNRVIDLRLDAENPRTAHRLLPSGKVKVADVAVLACLCMGLFIASCAQINKVCLMFSPFMGAMIVLYSFLKRWTWLCHFVMGVISACGPFMMWVALTGSWSVEVLVLAFAFMCSIAATDMVYGMQDCKYDSGAGLKSAAVVLGQKNTLRLSRLLHGCTVLALLFLAVWASLPWPFFVGVAGAATVLHFSHSQLSVDGSNVMLFRANTWTGIMVTLGAMGAWLWDGML